MTVQRHIIPARGFLSCAVFIILLILGSRSRTAKKYELTCERLSQTPSISSVIPGESDFRFNYNPGLIQETTVFHPDKPPSFVGLAVRGQNLNPNPKSQFDVAPSYIIFAKTMNASTFVFEKVSTKNVILFPRNYPGVVDQSLGAEDPRVAFDDVSRTYFLFYTAVSSTLLHSRWSRLALATCDASSPTVDFVACWKMRGLVFPGFPSCSKSAALLVRPTFSNGSRSVDSYLFWGDMSLPFAPIWIAKTTDLMNYERTSKELIATRPDHFDSLLTESGPPPLQLSDGNWLYLYNSARKYTIDPNPKNYTRQYNLGWVVLAQNDPTVVLDRAEVPLLTPVLDWERCDDHSGSYESWGLTPNVLFVEGWHQVDTDVFEIAYGACDSFVGRARVTVNVK